MKTIVKVDGEKAKEAYRKPYISEKKSGLEFVEELLRRQFGNNFAVTCSKCHHCR